MENEEQNMENIEELDDERTELTKEKYFELLEEWVNLQNALMASHYSRQSIVTRIERTPNQSPPRPQNNNQSLLESLRFYDPTRSDEIIRVNGGYDLVISPIYKRFLAELLDCIILLAFKLFILVVLVGLFDVNILLDLKVKGLDVKKVLEDDHSELLSLSTVFIVLEVFIKLMSCFYEAYCYNKFGASIGKMVLGIRVIQCEAIVPLQQPANFSQGIRALIFPATNLSFFRALIRSIMKNMMITLLFPLFFMMFSYNQNQLVFDIFCKSVVIEHNPNPRFVRRN